MEADGHSDTVASDVEVQMKQRCVTEFLHAEKMAPTDIRQLLLNVYGHQTVDVNTVKIGLHGQHFPRSDVIIAAVKQWVTSTDAYY